MTYVKGDIVRREKHFILDWPDIFCTVLNLYLQGISSGYRQYIRMQISADFTISLPCIFIQVSFLGHGGVGGKEEDEWTLQNKNMEDYNWIKTFIQYKAI